jgi:hypothetical protein
LNFIKLEKCWVLKRLDIAYTMTGRSIVITYDLFNKGKIKHWLLWILQCEKLIFELHIKIIRVHNQVFEWKLILLDAFFRTKIFLETEI